MPEPRPSARWRLRGEAAGRPLAYALQPGENRLGSVGDNDLVLSVRGVSRHHARLLVGPDEVVIEDLGSRNGTVVNGVRVQRTLLRVGDGVSVGPVSLRLEALPAGDERLALEMAAPASVAAAATPTGTMAMAGQVGLEVVEDVLLRLSTGPEWDASAALARVAGALGAVSACLFEGGAHGEPAVVAAHGVPSALPRDTAAPDRDGVVRFGVPGDPAGFGLALGEPGPERLAVAVWGGRPGPDSDRLLRLLLRLALALRPSGPPPRGRPRPGGLVLPEGYVPGTSPAMNAVHAQMELLLQGDLPVLILGETGVGKECLARILHDSSPRARGPFVAVNCAAIPAELLEAEMFGIGRGVATGVTERTGKFQQAHGGTLFLDEIGEMPLPLQAKLLRVLQERVVQPVGGAAVEVDLRVVSATNAEIRRHVEEGRFRRDLFYRVAGYQLEVPPLRDRREDVPALVAGLLGRFSREIGKPVRGVTVRALAALAAHRWTGNVRELEHEVRRLVYLCPEGQAIDSSLLSANLVSEAVEPVGDLDLEAQVNALERRLVTAALARAGGNRTAAARLLGISRNGLALKLTRLGIPD